MPLRSGGRFARAKRGELEKIQALLPLLRPLLQSGSLRSVLETAVGSAPLSPTPSGKGVQRQKQENAEEGWKRVRQAKRANVDQPPPRDTLQQDGWSVRVENTLAGFRHAKEGIFLATVKEAKELMLEMHSSGSLAVLAPININEKGTEISVLVQDRNGRMQSRQRFLHQLGDVPVQYQSTAPQGGSVQDGGTSQIVLNLSKQYTDKQGWEAAELAPRTAARRWLQHRAGVEVFDVRPPTRVAGREELQVVAQIASSTYDRALRASGMDGVMTRPFYTTEKEKTQFRPVPLPLDFTLEGALRKTSWLAERAFGVVTTRLGLAVRVRTADFEEVMRLVQPENYTKFLGELWDVSGLPLSWGPEAVTDFLAGWKVSPVRTFRQGYRRTWVVRALEPPMSAKLQHEFGLAVIKRSTAQKARTSPEIQKWMPASEQRKTERKAVFPQTWAAVVTASLPQKAQESRGQKRSTEMLGTSRPSKTVNLNNSPTSMDLGDTVQAPTRPSAVTPMTQGNLAELIARAVAEAMSPMDAQLKMLQTEIIAMKNLEGINGPDGMNVI